MRRLVASALALLLVAVLVACTAVISYDSDRDPEFQLLITTSGDPLATSGMLLFINIRAGYSAQVTFPALPNSLLATEGLRLPSGQRRECTLAPRFERGSQA